MRPLIGLAVLIIAATFAYVAAWSAGAFESHEARAAHTAVVVAQSNRDVALTNQDRELELQRRETLAPLVTAVQAINTLMPIVLELIGIYALVRLFNLAMHAGHNFANRIRPDAAGLYPVTQKQLDIIAQMALQFHAQQRMIEAQRPAVPTHYTYAPKVLPAHSEAEPLASPTEALTHAKLHAPTFAALLASGEVGRDKPLILGYTEDGQPIRGSVDDLLSVGIGGLSGSGKTSLVRFLASQVVLQGAKLVVLDPHCGAGRESLGDSLAPLAHAFALPVAREDDAIRDALQYVRTVLDARTAGRDVNRDRVVIVCDEFTALMRGDEADDVARLLEAIAQEGRKVGVSELLSGQLWGKARSGGTELRDSLTSRYCLRLRPTQARMLLGVYADELPRDTLSLPTGEGYYMPLIGGVMRVAIPLATHEDVVQVSRMLPSLSHPSAVQDSTADGVGLSSGRPMDSKADGNGNMVNSAQIGIVRQMIASGVSQAEIIKKLWGVDSNAGRPYRTARTELESIIANIVVNTS